MAKGCAVEGCDGKVNARGWCMAHYLRWWRYGDPTHDPRPVATHRTRVRPSRITG